MDRTAAEVPKAANLAQDKEFSLKLVIHSSEPLRMVYELCGIWKRLFRWPQSDKT
jgi:hypothetical protein